jgi:hypothetical protein
VNLEHYTQVRGIVSREAEGALDQRLEEASKNIQLASVGKNVGTLKEVVV